MANDCWNNVCGSDLKLPGTKFILIILFYVKSATYILFIGVWEIPMYAVNDNKNTAQLMDVYLAGSPSDVTAWSETNFERHYNGNRAPFGIYVHPSKYCK